MKSEDRAATHMQISNIPEQNSSSFLGKVIIVHTVGVGFMLSKYVKIQIESFNWKWTYNLAKLIHLAN